MWQLDLPAGWRNARQHGGHLDVVGKLTIISSTTRPWPMVREIGVIFGVGGPVPDAG
jgi:hypothetical protein